MDDRKKLIELIEKARKAMNKEEFSCDLARNSFIAEYLIANGTKIPVRCKDCKHTKTDESEDPAIYCKKWDRWEMPEDFFCGAGERKEDG